MIFQRIKDWWRGTSPLLGGTGRSSKWPKVRKAFLVGHPNCEVCGGNKKNEIHHIESFSQNPLRELDPTNFINLCESGKGGVVCHLHYGHLGNYRKINKNVIMDCELWNKKLKTMD